MSLSPVVIFDVDGVLWAAQEAYNRCTLFVAKEIAQEQGWSDAGLTLEDVYAFKRSGGFNSDWDMAWALVVLLQARSQGRIPPEKSWSALAEENAGRGLAWVRMYAGPDAPDFNQLKLIYDAYYWGLERYPAIYDREPVRRFSPGFAYAERPYARADLFQRLRNVGVPRVGIITGRNRNEMRTPMAALDFAGLLVPEAVFTDEDGHKPDPILLTRAIERLNASQAVMVGDSIDDLRLVQNYRQLPASQGAARVMFVAIDHDDNPRRWLKLGADAVLTDVNELPDWLTDLES